MPLNSRDLWLVLKAQDQTNRALSSFGRNVRNAGNQARAAQLEAAQAASMGTIAQAKLNAEVLRSEVAQLQATKAQARHTLATAEENKMTEKQILAEKAKIASIDEEIRTRTRQIAALRGVAANEAVHLQGIKEQIGQNAAYNRSIQDQEKGLAHLSGRFQSIAQTATAAGFAMAAAGVLTLVGIKKAIDVSVEYERQVRMTATQVSNFSGNLEELADIGKRVARDIAVPFQEIQPALFDVFSSMDVSVKEAEGLLRSFSKAAVAGQTDIQSVSRATIGILNAFHLPASDVNHILDIQFKLVQKGIGTYEEWNQRIGLVTPSAVRAGQSIEQMTAALAASTRMGISAARSSAAVSRAFDALSNPNAVKALKALGVSAQDAQGRFRPFNEVLRDFRAVLLKMPEKDRLKTILDVFKGAGGTIEARRFLQNILLGAGNLEMFDSILKETQNSAGAMEGAYTLMSNSVAAQTQLLKNQFMLLAEGVGKALIPAFTKLVAWLSTAVKAFNNLPEGTKKTVAMIILLAGVFAAIMGPLLLVLGALGSFVAAITIAGSAMLVTVGVISGLVVGIGLLVAAFIIAYKKSNEFRTLIGQIGQWLTLAKDAVVEFASQLKGAFDAKMAGPLAALADVVANKLMPQLTILGNFIVATVIPKVKEAGRILIDIFGKAFEFVGGIIRDVVVPAFQFASEWIGKHREEILKLLPVFAQIAKWVLIVAGVLTGVLVVALVGPVVAAFLAVAAVIAFFVAAFVYIQEAIGFVWAKMKEFWGWLSTTAISVWGAVTSAVSTALNFISTVISAFVSFVTAMWNNFWNGPMGRIVIAVWGLIKAVIGVAVAYIQLLIASFLQRISTDWNRVWTGIQIATAGVWTAIKNFVVGIVSAIGNFVTARLQAAKNTISAIWSGLVMATVGAWNAIKNAMIGPAQAAHDKVVGIMNSIKSFFAGAGHWLYGAGQAIVNGLVDGIESVIHKVTDALNRLTGIIKSHMPGSPVKKGPLRVLNNGRAGKAITTMIADGMVKGQPYLLDAVHRVMGNIQTGYDPNAPGVWPMNQGRYAGGAGKVYNINQTINTQEISPVRQAAALGWEVTTVM